ncbi:MAG: DMT family transporter [Lachnospiraceae bacterium]|nr:DMT family transporter [Lachnospiraceae bacterium]
MKNLKGTFILLLTALIWGTAFVAQTAASGTISAFTFNATRSVLASVFLFLFVLARAKITRIERKPLFRKETVKAGIICGIPLFLATNLQQYGIELYPEGTAASGRAGFITATYVIMIALYTLIRSKRFRPLILVATVVCMAGMYLLCLSGGFSKIYTGDILIFLCAVGFAVYILLVDRFGTVETVKVSCIQFGVVALLSLICMFLFEQPSWLAISQAWFPVCYAGILSSGIAYTLQMVGQKYAEPIVATIVMSLEAVFAALSGWLILSEKLKGRELIGCVLVFLAVILAQLPERKS